MPVRRADRRLPELTKQREDPRKSLGRKVLVHEWHVRSETGEVCAGGEHLLVRRRQHHAAHRGIVSGALQRVDQLAEQLVGQRVASVRLIERDRRNAGLRDGVADRGVGHRREAYAGSCGPDLPSEK